MEIFNITHLIFINFTPSLSIKDVVRPIKIKIEYRKSDETNDYKLMVLQLIVHEKKIFYYRMKVGKFK